MDDAAPVPGLPKSSATQTSRVRTRRVETQTSRTATGSSEDVAALALHTAKSEFHGFTYMQCEPAPRPGWPGAQRCRLLTSETAVPKAGQELVKSKLKLRKEADATFDPGFPLVFAPYKKSDEPRARVQAYVDPQKVPHDPMHP